MPRRPLLIAWLLAAAWVATPPDSWGQISVTGQKTLRGVVESVEEFRLAIRDDQGKRHELKIQHPGAGAVPLEDGRRLRFPADVRVEGRFPIESLSRDQRIRVEAPLNRRGLAESPIDAVWLADSEEPGVAAIDGNVPDDRDAFVPCRVVGAFKRVVKGRLLVDTPRGGFTRKRPLSFPLAKGAEARSSSRDHRDAVAGARVERAVVAKLNTGDRVIRLLRIAGNSNDTGPMTFDEKLAEKYADVPDDPMPPRTIRSRHFLFETDISRRQEKILLEKLERMIGLLSGYFGRAPSGIIRGYIVRDLPQWPPGSLPEARGIAKIREGAGICFSTRRGNVAQATVYSAANHGTVQHECTHAYCTMAFGSTGPTWLAEGVAEMGQYWREGEHAVSVDGVVLRYLQNANNKRSLQEIAVPGQSSGDWRDYAWRWALCHLLANNPNYADRFRPLAVGLMTQKKGASFAAAYGPVRDQISFEYDQFLAAIDNGYDARLAAWRWDARFAGLRGARPIESKIAARSGWQPSGVRVTAGEPLAVRATGEWRLDENGPSFSADGDASDGRGRLVGVVMSGFKLSEPFDLGADTTFAPPSSGDLYLRCNDRWRSLANNEGAMEVAIRLAE